MRRGDSKTGVRDSRGIAAAVRAFRTSVRADHDFVVSLRERYPTGGSSMRSSGVLGDAVQKIGFQMMIAVRVMRLADELPIPMGGQIVSRLIRHLYGAEIHWQATIAPGVAIVHGTGLVISHGATVGPGCVLSQHVTLGESIDPLSRAVGAPTLVREVHVGAGAVLLGPIEIGSGTKIMANAVVDRSVAPGSVVRTPGATVEARRSSTLVTPAENAHPDLLIITPTTAAGT